MSVWTWVLIGLCVAGVLLAAGSTAAVIVQAVRLRARLRDLKNSRLFVSIESLQMQTSRLSHTAEKAAPLMQRARAAIGTIREGTAQSGLPEAREALQQAGDEISSLIEDLR